jgi:nitroreductase
MKTKIFRRDFFKNILISGCAMLVPAFIRNAVAGQKDQAPLLSQSGNETLKTIHSLRTIHGNFTDQSISQKHLDLIMQASIQAPNGSGLQTYSIVVIQDREKMKKICGYQGGALLLYCVDYNRLIASANSLGHSYFPDGMQIFITGSTNTILAVQTAVIAAKALGIDSLTTNGIHRGDMQRVWDEVELPEKYCFPLIALVLGYPNEEPQIHKGRLDGPGIFHKEKYQLPTKAELTEITRKYDDDESHIRLSDAWKKEHEHYLDWLFTQRFGTYSKPQEKETQAIKMLKRSGFVDLQKV